MRDFLKGFKNFSKVGFRLVFQPRLFWRLVQCERRLRRLQRSREMLREISDLIGIEPAHDLGLGRINGEILAERIRRELLLDPSLDPTDLTEFQARKDIP